MQICNLGGMFEELTDILLIQASVTLQKIVSWLLPTRESLT